MTGAEVAGLIMAASALMSVIGNAIQWIAGKKWKTQAIDLKGTAETMTVAAQAMSAAIEKTSLDGRAKAVVRGITEGLESLGHAGIVDAVDALVQSTVSAVEACGVFGTTGNEAAYAERAARAIKIADAVRAGNKEAPK